MFLDACRMSSPHQHRIRTLWLAAILHVFTHLFQVILLPLYFLIVQDKQFAISTVEQATLLVTVLMLSYFVPAYPVGVLADRFSKRRLLAIGLAINAAAFVGLSLSTSYAQALACMVISGFGGSFYHPAATALIARLFPEAPGRALGLNGIGASAGFFLGPLYSGWRGVNAGWRAPILEAGIAGIVVAMVFYFLADEEPAHDAVHAHAEKNRLFPSAALLLFFLGAAFAFSLRDFTGSSMGSLGSLFLQKAHSLDPKITGAMLSTIFLASAISNPIFGGLSDRGLGRWTTFALLVAAATVFAVPHLPASYAVFVFPFYGFFFMATYPMVEGALMNAVPHHVRGRIFGLFITIGGILGNLAHWAAGAYVKHLGPDATSVGSYYMPYAVLAALLVLSLLGLPCLKGLRRREISESQLVPGMLPERP
jgi:MFS family permease